MAKDINKTAFDEATKTKLELFKLYLQAWLAIFFVQDTQEIQLFDFFAGSGTDSKGTFGSPLITLELIRNYCKKISDNNSNVIINLNDADKNKVMILNDRKNKFLEYCKSNYCDLDNQNCPFQVNIYNEDFAKLYDELYPQFQSRILPRFVLIDQYGIKQVNPRVFLKLISIRMTDIMFFISSSFIKRFAEQPEFQQYLIKENLSFDDTKFSHSHRMIFNYYKSMIPPDKEYYLGQFSIKKNNNYYGLIFGSNHPLGLEKFLENAWKIDPITGDANFDIDGDPIRTGKVSIFDDLNIPKKLTLYQNNLLEWLGESGKDNKEIYFFSLENGIAKSKSNLLLKNLEKEGKIIVKETNNPKRRKGDFYLDYKPKFKLKLKSNATN